MPRNKKRGFRPTPAPPPPPPPPAYEDEPEDDDPALDFQPTQMMSFQEAMSRHLPMAPGSNSDLPALPAPLPLQRPIEPPVELPFERPAVERPAVESPAVESPAVESPAGEYPAGERSAGEYPAGEYPAAEPPAVGLPAEPPELSPIEPTGEDPFSQPPPHLATVPIEVTVKPSDPALPPLDQPEVEWRDVDAHLRIRLRPLQSASADGASAQAAPVVRSLTVVGIGVEANERVILASDGPLCETEAIALRDIDSCIELDTGTSIPDLWSWLKNRDQ